MDRVHSAALLLRTFEENSVEALIKRCSNRVISDNLSLGMIHSLFSQTRLNLCIFTSLKWMVKKFIIMNSLELQVLIKTLEGFAKLALIHH